jgi:hypothetical protein
MRAALVKYCKWNLNTLNYKKSLLGSSVAFLVATSCCWLPALIMAIGGGSTLIAISHGLEKFSGAFMLIGIAFLGYGIYQFQYKKKVSVKKEVILESIITCPECGHKKEEIMPQDACQYFYECSDCKKILKPKESDCCVFCSYGTNPCPPIQLDQNCC